MFDIGTMTPSEWAAAAAGAFVVCCLAIYLGGVVYGIFVPKKPTDDESEG